MTTIENLLDELSAAPTAPDAYNQYAPDNPDNAIRRDNLRLYFEAMATRQPDTLLLMEAPGYRGCRLTGIPVTSRKILLEGILALGLFGSAQGYQNPADAGFERIVGEQTASIVWGVLSELQRMPLIWSTYPFHPHELDKPLTNRAPRKPEIAWGKQFLLQLLEVYQPKTVIAVGNVAHGALTDLNIPANKVRHPAQGGKNDFVAGIKALLAG